MKTVNTIWISTTPRTGSMWIFNVTREIYKTLGFDVEPSLVPQNDSEMFEIYNNKAVNELNNNLRFILKIHTLLKPNLARSKIITTVRDPRDVCISFKEFMKANFNESLNATKSLIHFSKIYNNFDKNYMLILKYENIEKNPIEIILKISKFLNENINHSQAVEISKNFSKKNVNEIINKKNKELKEKIFNNSKIDKKEVVIISNQNVRAYDKSTGFQTGHVSQRNSGDWKKTLSSEEIEIINSQFKDFLIENNYD